MSNSPPLNDKFLSLAASRSVISSSLPLNQQIVNTHLSFFHMTKVLNLGISQLIMSSPSPLNHRCADFIFSPSWTSLCCHVQSITSEQQNTLSLVILSQSCLVHHLWTNEYPISLFFIVTSSSSPLNDNILGLITPNLSRPVNHLWTDGLLDLPFFYP